jgi:hypothetical protein
MTGDPFEQPVVPSRPNINNFGGPIRPDETRAENAGSRGTRSLQSQVDELRADVIQLKIENPVP